MIEVSHLTKRYGAHTAVSDLSFTVPDGQIYGFLGPNGAGKSTTMNIMTGCLAATAGSVSIAGHDIFEQPLDAKKSIGYLPEQPPVYTEMTPREYLRFVGRAKGLSAAALFGEVERVCARTDILPVKDRLIRHLSKGYRQRVGLAQAMLGDPPIIILDEPTVGLDPAQIIEIRQLVRELGQRHTVLLSSHILPEVQAVCGHILILSHGRLVASDSPENLERLFAGEATAALAVRADEGAVRAVLEPLAGIRFALESCQNGVCRATVTGADGDTDALCERLFFAFAGARLPLLHMAGARASLEDVFLELTQADLTAGGESAAPGGLPAPADESPADEGPAPAEIPMPPAPAGTDAPETAREGGDEA